jgi:hypothetical protein
MKKRQKALREYLYTTPMILQYPGSFAGAHNSILYRTVIPIRATTCSHATRADPDAL